MRLLFLTDSLGYPRYYSGSSPDLVWPYKVRDALSVSSDLKLYFDMKPGRDTKSLMSEYDKHISAYEPDMVVLQVGIVDCAPRALKRSELQVALRIPIFSKVIHKLVKHYYIPLVKLRKITYVSPKSFKKNLELLKHKMKGASFIVLPIAPANNAYIQSNPLISEYIDKYNRILSEVFLEQYQSSVYENEEIDKLFLEDNHHLSNFGHEVVASFVIKKLIER